ncbi:IS1595 family transposase, partial [Halorubrum sp. SD690R]
MCEDRPAFGQRLAELAELGVIEFRPEPLDAIVERRLKTVWEERSCPHCGADNLHA